MASINGVTLKNVEWQADHEGIMIFSASVYIDKKRVGTYAQDYYAGPGNYDMPESAFQPLKKRAEDFAEGVQHIVWDEADIFADPDVFVDCVRKLYEEEKLYKKTSKNGDFPVLFTATDNFHTVTWPLGSRKVAYEDIQKALSSLYKNVEPNIGIWVRKTDFDAKISKEEPITHRMRMFLIPPIKTSLTLDEITETVNTAIAYCA